MKAEHCFDPLDINNLWVSRALNAEVSHPTRKKGDTTFVFCFVLFSLKCVDFSALPTSPCRSLIFEKYSNWAPRKRRNSMNTSAEMWIQRKCGRSSESWEMEPLGKCTRYAFISPCRRCCGGGKPSLDWLLLVKCFPFVSCFGFPPSSHHSIKWSFLAVSIPHVRS